MAQQTTGPIEQFRSMLNMSSLLRGEEIEAMLAYLRKLPLEAQKRLVSLIAVDTDSAVKWFDNNVGRVLRAIKVGNKGLTEKYFNELVKDMNQAESVLSDTVDLQELRKILA